MLPSRLLSSFSKQWVHLDTVSRQIFGEIWETQFAGSKIEFHVYLKNAFPGGIGNRRITFGYNLWFASHPSFIPWSITGVPSSQALPGFLITAPPPLLVPAVRTWRANCVHSNPFYLLFWREGQPIGRNSYIQIAREDYHALASSNQPSTHLPHTTNSHFSNSELKPPPTFTSTLGTVTL